MKNHIFIRIVTILIPFFGVKNMFAQSENKKISFSFNSGVGLYNPLIDNAKLASSGLLFSFQLQANYKTIYFSRLTFSQFSLSYKDNFKLNGLNINIEDRLETVNVGLDIGGVLFQKNKFRSYVYVGSGIATIYTPKINYDFQNSNFNLSKQINLYNSFDAGVGFEYQLHKLLIVSAEFEYRIIPFKIEVSNQQLNGIIAQINFKTNF